jgi:hypothetical protein
MAARRSMMVVEQDFLAKDPTRKLKIPKIFGRRTRRS